MSLDEQPAAIAVLHSAFRMPRLSCFEIKAAERAEH